jgi:hypothetical protein
MKKLGNFLKKNGACSDGYDFAKDMTLPEFLEKCERGDWILWLFARMNPDSLRELTLAKGHCANTVRVLMEDDRSVATVDAAIAFGEGKIGIEELREVAGAAWAAAGAAWAAAYAAGAADAAAGAADAAAGAADAAAYAAAYASWADRSAGAAARKQNRKQTADICRKYLPLEIWDQSKIK